MSSAFLVEDNPKIRESLAPALSELAGVELLGFAETERDAVSWLAVHGNDADFVILDIQLKEGSGLGVLLTNGCFHLPIKFFVLTNSATPELRARCMKLGAQAVFDKATELEEFFDRCRVTGARH